MSMPYLITAIVRPAAHAPYIKVSYVSNNPDVAYHMESVLDREYHEVLSVKSSPAANVELEELMYDRQGNMARVNNAPVLVGGTDVSENSLTDTDTGSDGPAAA